jgi:hypothetical protein
MAYTRPRSRGEAALSRRRRSHKVSPTDRGALRVHDDRECVGTIVPVAVDTVGPVERPNVVFDHRDRRVRASAGVREAGRAVSGKGRAS